jgi:hypothetical protein
VTEPHKLLIQSSRVAQTTTTKKALDRRQGCCHNVLDELAQAGHNDRQSSKPGKVSERRNMAKASKQDNMKITLRLYGKAVNVGASSEASIMSIWDIPGPGVVRASFVGSASH